MDIVYVIWLSYRNAKVAVSRGHNPMKYRLLTFALCFGLEILGSMLGIAISLAINPDSKSLLLPYIFAILGIVTGTVLSRKMVDKSPIEHSSIYRETAYQENPWQANSGGSYRRVDASAYMMQGEQLEKPATVHVINEYFWNDDAKDLFFLNGVPICTLQPGNEYSFLSTSIKNVFSIGRPDYPADDLQHSIKFVAAENGYIEITVKDGKIVADKFKNLKSK